MDDKDARIAMLTYRYRGLQYSLESVGRRAVTAKNYLQEVQILRDKVSEELNRQNNRLILAEREFDDLHNISKEITEMMKEIRELIIQLNNQEEE
jgi:predicted  nucleic acid-binding Zn-ribbon protein